MFDLCTGYKNTHIPESTLKQNPIPIKELRAKGELLSDKDWLLRIILLESFAGVPGMIAGTLRHLRSLRLLVSVTPRRPGSLHLAISRLRTDGAAPRWRMDPYPPRRSGERADAPPVRVPPKTWYAPQRTEAAEKRELTHPAAPS
jgi:hypothetical protein